MKTKKLLSGLLCLLLTVLLAFAMLPSAVLAADPETQVRVIVENTTYPESAGAPWDGTLVDTWVTIDDSSTMMSCVVAALNTISATQVGAEDNYISSVNGLAAFDGGSESGWMGTLNDWFTNEGFGAYTAAAGTLSAGDEIRIMYTVNGYGADLGGTWENTDNSVKAVAFSAGEPDADFSSSTYSYTLTLPAGTESLIVTPTATNKNYQVRTYLGTQAEGTEYKRTAAIPVENGSVITVVCGDPTWPSGNSSSAAKTYTFTVDVAAASTEPVFEIQAGSDDSYASIPGGTLSCSVGDTPARLKVVQTAGETVTPTKYKWKKAAAADGELGSAGSNSKTSKVNYLLSTTAMGETWFACEVTYTPEGGEETTVTVGRVKVSVNLTQAALETNAGFSTQPAGGSWGFGDSGDGVEDYGAILQAMPKTNLWGEGSSMMWKVSSDGGENWTPALDYGTDPTEVFEMGEYSLALYTLPVGNYKFKAVATFVTSDLAGNSLTATVDSNIVDVTIIDTSVDMDGDGTEASPYLIKTAADLQKISEMTAVTDFSGVYFKFDANITLPAGWTPIGTAANRFSGSIDGGGHLLTIPAGEKALIGSPMGATLKNLNIYGTQINGNGVVDIYTTGVKGFTAITIENVTLKSGTQTLGSGFVSGYAPGDYPAVIRNCSVEAGVIIGYDGTMSNIGSFGGDYNGTIIGCVSHATVKGVNYVGGISGGKGQTMGDYIIVDCIFDGEVIATGDNVGGISGGGYAGTSLGIASAPNTPCATIINCLVSGSITGANNVGGILGAEPGVKECWNNGIGYIQNNLFTGTLTATGADANVGGIIGYMSCINNMNVISGNFYKEGCGATAGIGAAGTVETPDMSGAMTTGPWAANYSGKKYGRTDDPMGAGAAALTKSCTATELTDGTVLTALNSGYNSSKNWVAGSSFPTFTANGAAHLYRIVCTTLNTMNGVTQEANGTAVTAGKTLTLLFTDGSKTTLSAEDGAVTKGYTVTTGMIGTYIPASLLYDGHQLVFNLGITNTLPVLQTGVEANASASAIVGTAYQLDLSTIFTDPDGDAPLTYTVKIGSASYVTAATEGGVYSYTPSASGSVTLVFKANDGTKTSAKTYTLTLTAKSADASVANLSVSGVTAAAGTANAYTVTVPYGTTVTKTSFSISPTSSSASITAEPAASGNVWSFTITAESGATATYTVTVSYGENPAQPNINAVAAAKTTVSGAGYNAAQSAVNTEAALKSIIEAKLGTLSLGGVSASVEMDSFTAAVAGSAGNSSGANGSFTATVTLSKGADATYASDTVQISGTITATSYTASGTDITVTFRLIGAELSAQDVDLSSSGYLPAYVTWIPTTSYTLDEDSTVYDLFMQALTEVGINSVGASDNYVETISAPYALGGYELSEFTNGVNSGWMYTLNGSHPANGLTEQVLSDGDVVIWHYVNDYLNEVSDWGGASSGTGAYHDGWLKASDVFGGKATEASDPFDPSDPSAPAGSSAVITPNVTVSGGTASSTVYTGNITEALEAAENTGAANVSVNVKSGEDVDSAKVTTSRINLKKIADSAGFGLLLNTPAGSLTLPNSALDSIVSQASGSIVFSVNRKTAADVADAGINAGDAIVVEVGITAGGSAVTTFGGSAVTVNVPADNTYTEGQSYRVIIISADGSKDIVYGKCVKVGGKLTVQVTATHLSTFVVTHKAPMSFTDISGHWAVEAVRYAWDNDLMNGVSVSGSLFDPEGTMSRAMLVTILYRLEGEPAVAAANPFADVPANEWYTNAVIWAAENKLVEGYGNGLFGPTDDITREQMAKMLFSYSQYKKYDTGKTNDLADFTDAGSVNAWALDAVRWANAEGLINGRTATTIVPGGNAKRAEAATMLMRYILNIVK